jgi:hypothetical protein
LKNGPRKRWQTTLRSSLRSDAFGWLFTQRVCHHQKQYTAQITHLDFHLISLSLIFTRSQKTKSATEKAKSVKCQRNVK